MPVARSSITTARLTLRPLMAEDAAFLATVLGDPEVMAFSEAGALDAGGVRAWLAAEIARSPGGFARRAICIADTGTLIGYAGLTQDRGRAARDAGELGVRLARRAWGHGYASEAATALLIAGFRDHRLAAIEAEVDPGNTASCRLCGRLGLRVVGEVMHEGYDHPDLLFALERAEAIRRFPQIAP